MIRLVAVDLDGTLVRSDTTVSRRTAAALSRAAGNGARIVIVTARPPRFIQTLLDDLGITGTAICANGALVHDLDTGTTEIAVPLPAAVAQRAAATLAGAVPGIAFAVETGHRAVIGPGYGHISTMEMEQAPVATLAELWAAADPCVKLLAWSPSPVTDQYLALVKALLPDVTVTYSGGTGMIEIHAPGVSKRSALRTLCSASGIRREEVVAFGDMPNDTPMLRWAGLSCAVANAHPEVLACADRITGSNDADGVAAVLEELFPADPTTATTTPGTAATATTAPGTAATATTAPGTAAHPRSPVS
ncbi:MAG: HAD family phosphatase [Micromonosporaceae bacterium]|nr:HAD family phosphatase [Micromonosporaceae bacterium]